MARRSATATTLAAPAALPVDVRLTQWLATGLFVVVALGLAGAAWVWLQRTPLLPIRGIQLEGELTRNSAAGVRASALPLLQGNFIGIDLPTSRAAFETLPWVRHAVVRRVWPDKLAVKLEEHRAAALWEGENEDSAPIDRLVNDQGEVFEASALDVEDDRLPRFAGPDASAARMLALYRRIQPAFDKLEWTVERVLLSGRGSWRIELDNGAVIELGRGSGNDDSEVVARCERFARTLMDAPVVKRFRQPLEYADLRHRDGYALRLRGVTTTAVAANKQQN
jgi:cell division protein FtsQ